MAESTNNGDASAGRAPRVPPYISGDPALWFVQLETYFAFSRYADDETQFRLVIMNVTGDVLMAVRDLATNPPATGKCPDNLLRTLFLERLPEKVRTILAVSVNADLSMLAEQADRICEQFGVLEPTREACAIARPPSTLAASSELARGTCAQARSLQFTWQKSVTTQGGSKDGLCYVHRKYGDRARHCHAPCSWTSRQAEN
ncbi:uncharacterized protein LOC143305609 [Osmia lignaria lignaria]|uniref:uncharacterized protein LOC143305609 n=1 Tax=Osmia lignaria lignaria TaxID=1437193 RepID=UPI00402B86A1